MFEYYTSKILFVLYDNCTCDDAYSFYLLFLRVLVTMSLIPYVYENTVTTKIGKYCVAFVVN